MLERFTFNDLLSDRLKDPEVKEQFSGIVQFVHNVGLDWYFTEVPDLRCGRKELNNARASDVCFRVWFKNLNEIRIPAGRRLGFQDTKIPLKKRDFNLLKEYIEKFAEENPLQRQNAAFFPDEYQQSVPDAGGKSRGSDAISRMIRTMLSTVAHSNGQEVIRIMKNKETSFNEGEAQIYLRKLFDDQDGLCAITGIPLEINDKAMDGELLCSLDRKDSNGHYEEGNLQIVCRFVNRWKGISADGEFRRLIDLVRSPRY
jgi:hypothetical protein